MDGPVASGGGVLLSLRSPGATPGRRQAGLVLSAVWDDHGEEQRHLKASPLAHHSPPVFF